ncbi:hypothetical protein [Desulforamulus aeronauticus]|uniref:Uncharacterized protein n=1 Tax=Desulforamulus aeronauticus DSM 10349 TaxID=1121421 RepID=A0A1M6UJ44_9FIRM|nr:hypothetical protein [Desulforamulus aeronauticus]SHK69201.1 hypothetical protein SAMN02745123_02798 [Desulforamulus aeronauticus DSM 10349]
MVSQQELSRMTETEREIYLVDVLERKLNELKHSVMTAEQKEEHGHGPEFQRGMTAGFVSGLALASRVLMPEKAISSKVLEVLEQYNTWAQNFNRQGKRARTEKD